MSANNMLNDILRQRGLLHEDSVPGASVSPLPVETEAGEGQPAGPTEGNSELVIDAPEPEDNDEIAVIESPEDADDVAVDATIDAEQDADEDDDADIAQSFDRLTMLTDAMVAIDQFGMSPTGAALGQITGLFDSTALYTMGCESFGSGSETEKQMGLESLASAVGETAERVGGKLLARAGGWGTKLIEVVTKSGESVANASVKLAEADKGAAAAGTTFGRKAASTVADTAAKVRGGAKTAMIIAGAIAGVGAVITLAVRTMPKQATEEATKTWFGKIRAAVAGVKWPFGKLEVKPEADASGIRGMLGKLFCGGKPAKSAEAGAAGFIGKAAAWTKESATAVKDAIARAIKAVIEAIKGAAKSFTEALKAGASKVSGAASSASDSAGTVFGKIRGVAADAVNAVGTGARGADVGGMVAAGSRGAGERGMHVAGILSHGTYFAGVAAVLALLGGLVYFVVVGGCRLVKKSFGG